MSAMRYCGNLSVRLTYIDRACEYRCVVSNGTDRAVLYVGTPACLSYAVDSPEAFDDTAHAALSFAADDDETNDNAWIEREADFSDSGWAIRRKR